MARRQTWDVKLAADDRAVTDTCLYVPTKALPAVDLPRRLLARGPNGLPALVGSTSVDGGDDETTLRVTPNLLRKLAPGQEDKLDVAATITRATWVDVFVHTERGDRIKVLTALVAALAAIAAAVAAFLTSKAGVGLAATVLTLAALGAALKARQEIRDIFKPACGKA